MAYFATLNESNIVIRVESINNVVILDDDDVEQEQLGIDFLISLYGAGNYKQTSYNRNIRKNFAGIGDTYDTTRDAFIPPKPYASWTLVEDTCLWEAPVAYPDDDKYYEWNEAITNWDIPPQPYASWTLNDNNHWQPPVTYPNDGKDYEWDEATTNWVERE
jgi:hypothetical protein